MGWHSGSTVTNSNWQLTGPAVSLCTCIVDRPSGAVPELRVVGTSKRLLGKSRPPRRKLSGFLLKIFTGAYEGLPWKSFGNGEADGHGLCS
ncbi:hypothetical protein ColKHC_12500 [Colletotrichum higginsianum]|nr:hypothetical protein ColKHC_12500 [Colletotrichum higginsianum]